MFQVEDFAQRLKSCREKKKAGNSRWTQQYVAERIGMARTTYTAYENGTKMPPPDTINNIAILLDVSNDYLMGRTTTPAQSWEDFILLPVVSKLTLENQTYSTENVFTQCPTEKRLLSDGTHVWLEVNMSSMVNVGIRPGSKVLIRLQSEVENGDIAAVCVNGEDAILKKVYCSNDQISLVSENASIDDQVFPKEDVVIKGKAIWLTTSL